MTPDAVGSLGHKSELIANTPCVEEYFISRTSSQNQNFETPTNEQASLLSTQNKQRRDDTELKQSINEIDTDSSDDDDDEDYEEEFKGTALVTDFI